VAAALSFAPATNDADDVDGNQSWCLAREVTEPSALIFTSGTESSPKGILHSEATANAGVRLSHDHLGLGPDEIVWMPSPIGHSTGFNFGVRMAFFYGYPLVLQDRWNPEAAVDLIGGTRATYTLAATTFLADIVGVCERRAVSLPSMRFFGCGGAPVPSPLVRRAGEAGIGVLRLYGSTETLVPAWNTPQSPLQQRMNTDGAPLRGIDIEIRDESDEVCQLGTVGEICVRGPEVCLGFFDDPERLASAFTADGRLRTGDLGYLDDLGYLTIDGRRKEIIIRGGLNISPREIEQLIVALPAVHECVVVGLPDDRLGEISCACVMLAEEASLTLPEVTSHLLEAGLARYKLPERLMVVDSLPKTPSGKVRREILVKAWAGADQLADERERRASGMGYFVPLGDWKCPRAAARSGEDEVAYGRAGVQQSGPRSVGTACHPQKSMHHRRLVQVPHGDAGCPQCFGIVGALITQWIELGRDDDCRGHPAKIAGPDRADHPVVAYIQAGVLIPEPSHGCRAERRGVPVFGV
jgi:acyl-CoA synthetase (AMP-forming)/AMP-acid ligase II